MLENFNTVDNNLGTVENIDVENNQTPDTGGIPAPTTDGNVGGGGTPQKTNTVPPPVTSSSFLDAQQFFENKLSKSESFRRPELFKEYRTIPGENTEGRFLDAKFGFSPILDNEDFYAQRQSGINKLGIGLLKLPTLVATKVGSGVGFLGALVNPVNWVDENGYFSAVADNSISGFFDTWENSIKNNWLPTFQEAEDRDQGFFKSLGDANFWAEDFVDGAAFMASAWIPGMALSKLGLAKGAITGLSRLGRVGAETLGASIEGAESVANYFQNAAKYAKTIDKFNAWALATSSESMFEAKGVKDVLTESLKDSNYTEEEKKKIIGSNTKDTFLMNAVLLGATNLFELPLVNKILGKADGAIGNIASMTRFGEEAAVKEASSKLGKILSNKYATIAKDVISGTFREGFVEENGQLAIQKYHEELGAAGKIADVLDLNNYANVAKKTYQQTRDVFGLGDKPNIEAEKSIGLGAILGGGQTAIANRIQSKRDKLTTEQAITMYNQAQQSWLKFGNPYLTETIVSKDENGEEVKKEKIVFDSNNKPVIDQKKLDSIISSVSMNSGIMVASDKQENLSIRNLLRDNAFADFVIAHIQIGQEDKLKTKLDALSTATPEELAKFGFAPDETSADQINRYRSLADTIIKQNKIINNDILYDGTPEDQARKIKLTELAAQQAVYRNLRVDENRMLNEVKNQILTPENSSLSDGIVDQLNMLKLRIQDMDKYIDDLKTNKSSKKTSLAVAEKNRQELQEEYDNLLKTNELSVKDLKQDSKGFYQYEKNERNDPTLLTPLVKRMYYLGSLENTVKKLGKEWASFADFKNGKKNFLANFDETITQVINNKIETDNSDRDITDIDEEPQQGSENFEDLVDTSEFDVEPQDFDFLGNAIPKLDDYLKNLYDLEKSKNNISKPFEEWKTSEDANPYIKTYNDKYDKKESLNTKKDTTEPAELPEDFVDDEEGGEELPNDFFGTTFLDSIKLGPYVIHKGDLIDDKLVELITDSNIIIAGEPYLHNEVLQMIDIFKGRNIKSKVTPAPAPTNQNDPDEFENGEIQNVQDTRNSVINTILQKIIDAFDQTRGIIFGGSDKVVSGIKVNNRSDEYEMTVVSANRVDRKRTTASPNYPLVLGTKAINIGTKLIISANYDVDDFEEENVLDPTDTKTRKRSNFFTVDNKVHDNVKDEFPIKIETIVNGEKVLLGHLPTMSWLTARYPDGNTMNVVEFTKGPSGEQINNLENQIRFVKDLRETIFKGHNSNTKFELYANVNRKSLGKLRLDESEGGKRNLNKLSQVLHPKTKLGIIKGGKIRVGTNETLDPDNFIGNKNLKNIEGFPVFFIDTPTEKQLFSFASVPKLAEQHTNLIIEGWIAFHELNNKTETRKTGAELEKYKNVVKAIYAAYGNEYDEKFNIDFNILKNYINDYVTFRSNKKDYNPLLKEGTGQMNITPTGELVVWVVKDKTKPKDILYIESLKEFRFGDKSKQLQEKLKSLYYTVKASSDTANGINSNVKMQFLSYDNNKKQVVKSKPMTYNEYIMNILETNIEKGRPVDPSNPDSPYVHFANPVVNFSYTPNDNNLKDLEQKTTTTNPPPAPAAPTAPVSTNTKTNIENKRKEEIKQKAPYVLIQGFYEGDNNTIATLTFKSNIDNTYAYAEKQINISTDALRNDPALSKITKEQYNAAILAPKIIDEIDRKYDIEIAKELYKELKAGKKLRDMSMSEMKIVTKYLTSEFKIQLDAQEAGTKKSNVQNDLIVTKNVLQDLSLLLKDYMNIEDESDRLKTVKGFVNSFRNGNLNKLGINDDLITNFLTGKFRYIAQVKDIIDSQINKAPLDKPINLVQITDLKQMYNTGFKERPDHKDWYVEHHLKVVEAIVDDLSSKYGGDPNMLKLMVYTHDLAKALNNETKTHYQTIEPILKNMGFSNELIKELSKNLELMDKVKTEKIDNLPIEVKIVSTADALSHYTTGKNGFLNIFSTITSKEDMSKIADSNKAKIQKDQNKILLPGFDLSNVKLDYNGRVTYVQGDIPSYVNSVMGISEEQTKTDASTGLLDLDINFGESASSIGDIDDSEPPFSIRTNNLKDVKKICK
jgi:hypothetical protein